MKESLTFPYSYGMEFVVKLMRKGGKERAFADVLQNPPHTTRQIMQPETYLAGEKIEPMRIPDFKHDFKDYREVRYRRDGRIRRGRADRAIRGKAALEATVSGMAGWILLRGQAETNQTDTAAAPLGCCTFRAGRVRTRPQSLRKFMRSRSSNATRKQKRSGDPP